MRRRFTNHAHVVLRKDGEAAGLEVQMLGRVKECLRNGIEQIMRLT